jgi:biopolymer transport protein ExbD
MKSLGFFEAFARSTERRKELPMTSQASEAVGRMLGEINVTPMIDILLVLLIIFMVIAPVTPHGLAADLPQRSVKANPIPEAPIVVRIMSASSGQPSYKIDTDDVGQDDVSLDELGSRLSSILSVRADKAMFIKADTRGDDRLEFSTIATVMDIGKSAGADRIGLLTSKDPL